MLDECAVLSDAPSPVATQAVHGLPPQMATVSSSRLKEMTTKELQQATHPTPLQAQDAASAAEGAGRE
jgi:hypothetical protein